MIDPTLKVIAQRALCNKMICRECYARLHKDAKNCNLFDVCNTKKTWSIINAAVKNTLDGIKIKDIKNNSIS